MIRDIHGDCPAVMYGEREGESEAAGTERDHGRDVNGVQ